MSCGPGDKFKLGKKNKGIASCANPGSPKPVKFKLKDKSTTTTKPVSGKSSLNMNVRNLSDDPGTIRPVVENPKGSLTSEQMKQASADETQTSKSRKIFKLKKRSY